MDNFENETVKPEENTTGFGTDGNESDIGEKTEPQAFSEADFGNTDNIDAAAEETAYDENVAGEISDEEADGNSDGEDNSSASDYLNAEETDIGTPNDYFEKVNPTPVVAVKDYKSMSKGLKVFSAILALVILMTACCAAGYFFGKNGSSSNLFNEISVDLSSKPKNTDEMTAAEVYDKVNKSIVGITVYSKSGDSAIASGVIYSKDGYVVTNDHIYAEIASPKFKIYDYKGNEYDAEYVAGDTVSDLALLKIKDAKNFAVSDFGDSNDTVCGENVVAIGRPSDARANSSITKGIISSTKRRMKTTSSYTSTLIQTDSAINPGSSGGALVNMYGQIIGITSSKLSGEDYDLMGFAIPTTTVKRVVTQLSKNGKVEDRAKLGITYQEITSISKELGEYIDTGLYIASVTEDSALYGKVTKGSIITHVNGKRITVSDDILDVIEASKAGDTISLTIIDAGGKAKDYSVKLAANVGESSYSTTKSGFSESETPKIPDNTPKDDGGTFNFPQGE